MITHTYYQCGTRSQAGFAIRYTPLYNTIEKAREIAEGLSPSTLIFKITVQEVK